MFTQFHHVIAAVALIIPAASVQNPTNTTGTAGLATPGPDSNGFYVISSEGIRANFVPYGSAVSNLFKLDLVVGFDKATAYTEGIHAHLGSVPGRYYGRIKNSSFDVDGTTYHVLPNENNDNDTLHGGPDGWDYRNWTVVAHTTDSVKFSLIDPAGMQGFPGEIICYVTYTLTPYRWFMRMVAMATTKKTPIMLSSHTYWNLDGFRNPNTAEILNHTFYVPEGGQRLDIDNIEVPNGEVLSNPKYSVWDFWSSPKQIGSNITSPDLTGGCGYSCTGYDTPFIINSDQLGPYDWRQTPLSTISSNFSGIELNIYSNQQLFQMYTCNVMDGTFPLKKTQGFFNDSSHPCVVEKFGCVVLDVADWLDGINHPEWKRKQIYGPDSEPYVLEAIYDFSVNK
ncbi:galactose mutarotase-like protein [Penicillium malachiteum]|uniref:Galactose mutarotase-like protein n=1 Tax=Penicillium malachiteum TaxID=1324776 RepID=A0AAD6MYZ7_9EURO|nr:galactose mutarotase-like protein [Penicillium malachiteum]